MTKPTNTSPPIYRFIKHQGFESATEMACFEFRLRITIETSHTPRTNTKFVMLVKIYIFYKGNYQPYLVEAGDSAPAATFKKISKKPVLFPPRQPLKIRLTEYKGELRVDSRLLAKKLHTPHKALTNLVDQNIEKLLKLGLVLVNIEIPSADTNSGRERKLALLNEAQALFLIELARNLEHLVELKTELIMAFRRAKCESACQTLKMRRREASESGRRLARWRYDKADIYQHVAHLYEQLELPLPLSASSR